MHSAFSTAEDTACIVEIQRGSHGVFAMVVSAPRKLPAAPWPSVRIPEKVMPNISPSAIVGSEKLASAQSNRRQSAAAGAPPPPLSCVLAQQAWRLST